MRWINAAILRVSRGCDQDDSCAYRRRRYFRGAGRRSPAVRPREESPDTTRQQAVENTRAQRAKARGDRQCHRKQTALRSSKDSRGVRVKRRGKSPPPAEQSAGHEKPPAVQDKTGGPASGPLSQESSLRVIVALAAQAPARAAGQSPPGDVERNDRRLPREWEEQNPAYRQQKRGASGKPGAPSLFAVSAETLPTSVTSRCTTASPACG